jgi:acyl-CoA thioester hydrolase
MFDTVVAFGQCDPNGHLNTAQYTALFDRASSLFLEHLGIHDGYGPEAKMGWADARVTVEYKHEVRVGERIRLLSSMTRVGRTSINLRHEMRSTDGVTLFATYESVTVRFDLVKRAPAPVPEHLRAMVT